MINISINVLSTKLIPGHYNQSTQINVIYMTLVAAHRPTKRLPLATLCNVIIMDRSLIVFGSEFAKTWSKNVRSSQMCLTVETSYIPIGANVCLLRAVLLFLWEEAVRDCH